MRRCHSPARRGGVKLIILAVIGLAAGVGAGWAVWGRTVEDPAAVLERREEPEDPKKKHKKADLDELTYIGMGSFLVNIVAEDRLRYLQVEISLGVSGMDEKEEAKAGGGHGHGAAEEEKPALSPATDTMARDIIVRVLAQQTFEDLRTNPAGTELKRQLQKELDAAIYECTVEAVLFTSFLMQ